MTVYPKKTTGSPRNCCHGQILELLGKNVGGVSTVYYGSFVDYFFILINFKYGIMDFSTFSSFLRWLILRSVFSYV